VTTRERDPDLQRIDYTNAEGDQVSVGMSLIGFGQPALPWDTLNTYSRLAERPESVALSISGLMEIGTYDVDEHGKVQDKLGAVALLMRDINQSIATARDRDLMIYVHGAKVNFYNANAFAAQLDHFMGRDMTSMAFSWPSRQNILMYGSGLDVQRAYRAAPELATLLEMLARKTTARRIHIICWSAGGRVVNDALRILHERHAGEGVDLRKTLRIGTVYFAAADVPGDEFLEVLPATNEIVQRVVVTVSSKDGALAMSKLFLGDHGGRIGLRRTDLSDEEKDIVLAADRLEVIDVSRGWEGRGFDITGHRYWFDHPWASTDMILAVRSDLDPEERALGKTDVDRLWTLPEDYPERLRTLLNRPDLIIRRDD
jgi:esterase/lipase superfamily enzyme